MRLEVYVLYMRYITKERTGHGAREPESYQI
jgi:hypothetical protein